MALAKLNSLLKSLSGKLSKSENEVFYNKFGQTWVWTNKGVHSFNAAQIAVQTMMTQASTQVGTIMANATQKATYMASFKAQTKYKTFRGYLMATVFQQLQNSAND